MTKITTVSPRGIDLVAKFEGFRAHVYPDMVGVRTIGYGETSPAILERYKAGISEPAARKLLRDRLNKDYGAAVQSLGLPLTQAMFDALTSFVYNVGTGAIGPDTTVGRLLREAGALQVKADERSKKFGQGLVLRAKARLGWRAAANSLLAWNMADGKPVAGLTTRRKAERALFVKNLPGKGA